ncbi:MULTISPECIES: helix-turn-helix domain-containing protein [Pseudomonas]
MVRHCRTVPHQKRVFRMSYSEHWRREFFARHPEYESQSQVLQQEVAEPPSVSFAFPLSTFITANSESSVQPPQQGAKRQHHPIQDCSMSSGIIRQVCCLRQRLNLTQQELAKQLGISSRTLQDWEQGRRQPKGPGRALLLQWFVLQAPLA